MIGEAEQLTRSTIFSFIGQNACLIMPQVHPLGVLPSELADSSQALARTVFERLTHLLETDTSATFKKSAIQFLTRFEPARSSHHFSVYRTYHWSVFGSVKGCRVDPSHPFVRFILENPGGLLTSAQQLASISLLNGFEGNYSRRPTGADVRTAFATAVGGEERLRQLFGVQTQAPPDQFIEGLVRFPLMGQSLAGHHGDGAVALRDIRGQYIDEYLVNHPNLVLSFAQAHTLYDLCAGTQSQPVARRIRARALPSAHDLDLSQLSNEDLLDTYQRLAVMGVIDRSVSLETRFTAELESRLTTMTDIAAREALLRNLAYPRPFTVDEPHSLLFVTSRFDSDRFSNIAHISSMYTPPNR